MTSGVGLKDLTPFAKIRVRGPDAFAFLDRVVAGRVPKDAGRTTLAHALTPVEAKVYAEFTLTRVSNEEFMVVTGAGVEGHDLRHLEQVRSISQT